MAVLILATLLQTKKVSAATPDQNNTAQKVKITSTSRPYTFNSFNIPNFKSSKAATNFILNEDDDDWYEVDSSGSATAYISFVYLDTGIALPQLLPATQNIYLHELENSTDDYPFYTEMYTGIDFIDIDQITVGSDTFNANALTYDGDVEVVPSEMFDNKYTYIDDLDYSVPPSFTLSGEAGILLSTDCYPFYFVRGLTGTITQ